jgi:hypothetical protein
MIQRSREGSDRLKARFAALEESLSHLGKKQDQARQHLTHSLERNHGELRNQIAALLQANEAISARLVELEKPRGLRALFRWLFGRHKPAPGADGEPESGAG